MGSAALQDTEFRYRAVAGDWVVTRLGEADLAEVVRGLPVRAFPTYRGQRNYPGWLWLSTTCSLVGYESLLERDRLWLADFDPAVSWVSSQPFWVSGRDGSQVRRHVPDFLLQTTTGFVVVDVKPAELVNDARVAAVMGWTRRLCAARGWRYEVWSGADPVLLRNVRFMATVRRQVLVAEDVVGRVADAARAGMTIAQVEAAAGVEVEQGRPASLTLLWTRRWSVDLTRPLTGSSVLKDVA
ncbi:MAG: TnsA-like heteromeric transposase endonuclease subunit [Micropruina sp.]|uniref:TnsA-like heteromeric transposase endonuclease subunit n=1 Tax=Micropruina sp. TaxID=2737536 RepID=UPI0039E6CF5D